MFIYIHLFNSNHIYLQNYFSPKFLFVQQNGTHERRLHSGQATFFFTAAGAYPPGAGASGPSGTPYAGSSSRVSTRKLLGLLSTQLNKFKLKFKPYSSIKKL